MISNERCLAIWEALVLINTTIDDSKAKFQLRTIRQYVPKCFSMKIELIISSYNVS